MRCRPLEIFSFGEEEVEFRRRGKYEGKRLENRRGRKGNRVSEGPAQDLSREGFTVTPADGGAEKRLRPPVHSHGTLVRGTPVTRRAVHFRHRCSPRLLCFLKKRGFLSSTASDHSADR